MKNLYHSYDNLSGGAWLRGNLHTHTTNSDGARDPQPVIDDYASRGYDFLSISDHDIFTGVEQYAAWESRGLILVPGNEVTARGSHMLHVNGDRRLEPNEDRQRVIDEAAAGPGFIIVNHPNWERFNHCPIDRLRAWQGYAGMEIFNGVVSRLEGSNYATNEWDMLLTEGRRVWGFANDDSHEPCDMELGWNVAYVTDPTPQGVVEALREGRFYASTGVVINQIEVDGNWVKIGAENAERIVAIADMGRRIAVTDGSEIEVEVPPGVGYVRFECWGRGERFAWTQPFWTAPGN